MSRQLFGDLFGKQRVQSPALIDGRQLLELSFFVFLEFPALALQVRTLGIGLRTLYRKLIEYGIN